MDALFPEMPFDVTANEVVLVHGCDSGLSGVRRVTAALVEDFLLASGGGVLRGVVVSAAVYGWWCGALVEQGSLVNVEVRSPHRGSCAQGGSGRAGETARPSEGRGWVWRRWGRCVVPVVQLRFVLPPGPPGEEPPAEEQHWRCRRGSAMVWVRHEGWAPRLLPQARWPKGRVASGRRDR